MSPTYSQAMLAGLAKLRPAMTDVTDATGIVAARLAAVGRGDDEFTDGEVGSIEDAADLTGLELALAAVRPDGAPPDPIADGCARVREAEKAARAPAVVQTPVSIG